MSVLKVTTVRLPANMIKRIKKLVPKAEKTYPDRGASSSADVMRMALAVGVKALEEEFRAPRRRSIGNNK